MDPGALPYRPCVGVILTPGDGTVFAGERLDAPGAWQMPQGGIDPGETAAAAALRELTEETGIRPGLVRLEAMTARPLRYDLPADLLGRAWGGRFRGQEIAWARLRFEGADADVDLSGIGHAPEFSRWRWMTPAALTAAVIPFKREVYAAAFAELMGSPARRVASRRGGP